MTSLKFTQLAREDFLDIGDYIAKDNPAAALHFVNRLQERCGELLDYPGIGRKRDNLSPHLPSITEGEYVIFYRLRVDDVEIMRVIHGKRDLGKFALQIEDRAQSDDLEPLIRADRPV